MNLVLFSDFLKRKNFALLFYGIPPILTIIFVNVYIVNVPYWDQWAWIDIFEKFYNNTLTFEDLYRQHNEHRMVIPRLLYLGLAFISKWNIVVEAHFSLLIITTNFILLYNLSSATVRKKKYWLFHLTNFLTCIILFSVTQHESLLRGEQLAWFLINFCVISSIVSINKFSGLKRILIAAIFCGIASFSSSHGLISWLAMFPAILLTTNSRKQFYKDGFLWIIMFINCAFWYLHDWELPPTPGGKMFVLENPLKAISYFTAFVGTPLTLHNQNITLISPKTQIIASIIGFIVLSIFILTAYLTIRNKQLRAIAALWISLGLFSIIIAFLTTVGRASFGNIQAFSSRYITYSGLLLISLIQLCSLYFQNTTANKFKKWARQFYKFSLGLMIALFIVMSLQTLNIAQETNNTRKHSALCLELVHFLDVNFLEQNPTHNCMDDLYYYPVPQLKEKAEVLEEIGFKNFPKQLSRIKNPTFTYGYLDVAQNSMVKASPSDMITASGWAVLPDSPAEIVLLSYNNRSRFFLTAYVHLPSPDIANLFQSEKYNQSRWSVEFSLSSFPLGKGTIEAWVYHPEQEKLVKLEGQLKVNIVEKS